MTGSFKATNFELFEELENWELLLKDTGKENKMYTLMTSSSISRFLATIWAIWFVNINLNNSCSKTSLEKNVKLSKWISTFLVLVQHFKYHFQYPPLKKNLLWIIKLTSSAYSGVCKSKGSLKANERPNAFDTLIFPSYLIKFPLW